MATQNKLPGCVWYRVPNKTENDLCVEAGGNIQIVRVTMAPANLNLFKTDCKTDALRSIIA
eukprot:8680656-Lingulodinium_polyedra.AAC.1